MANQDLFFDITKQGTEQEKQQYIISRVGNGRPYNITDLTPVFEGVKPDGERIIDTTGGLVLDPRNGVFRYILPQQASTAEGDYQQAFFKLKRGEQTDSSLEVRIRVLKNKVEFGINSESYCTGYQKELERVRKTVNTGIDELKHTAEATEVKINSEVETAKALDTQLKALQSAINSNQLATREDLTSQIKPLSDQVVAFTNSLETTKDTVNANVQKLVDTKMDAGVAPGVLSNPANITKSGNYYYNSSTQGLPTLNGSNANGIIQAVMRDENNGMLSILGTGLTREKYKGKLYDRWKSSTPILLWSGRASSGDTVQLKDDVHNYGQLIINVTFTSNRHATHFVTVPNNGETLYLNNIGLRSSGNGYKNGYLDELSILFKDNNRIQVVKSLLATDGEQAINSDTAITAIYGIY